MEGERSVPLVDFERSVHGRMANGNGSKVTSPDMHLVIILLRHTMRHKGVRIWGREKLNRGQKREENNSAQ